MQETELIAQAQRGDKTAREDLVRMHQEAAFRLAYLLSGDADEAADIVQEAFIRAFRSLDRFDHQRPFRPWLLRITANHARNRRRTAGRYMAMVGRLFRAAPVSAPNPEREVVDRLQSVTLWEAVRRLNPANQEVIYLRYYLDFSEAEMAEAIDIATGTVKSRLHRALKQLRQIIEREFPDLWGRDFRGSDKFSPKSESDKIS
ncbi:MAG: RNA polymerase sigma factor [Chloroflexi bacterium]|nr:RNA polymerase sigma factor [Chloroflexota bacterium]